METKEDIEKPRGGRRKRFCEPHHFYTPYKTTNERATHAHQNTDAHEPFLAKV